MRNLLVLLDSGVLTVTGIRQTPDGYLDEPVQMRVAGQDVDELPQLPVKPEYYADTLAVWFPGSCRWVCFNRLWWQEKSSGSQPMEESLDPPFQVDIARLAPPNADEDAADGVYFKWINLYPDRQICPKCGKQGICYSQDVGAGNTFWDLYCLHCPECGHAEFCDMYAGEKDCSEEKTTCRYCGRHCYEHESLPEELMRRYREFQKGDPLSIIRAKLWGPLRSLAIPQVAKKLDVTCPKCGQQTVWCCYKDVGLVDYYENYYHICITPDCDYFEVVERFFTLGQEDPNDAITCPFCGRNPHKDN